MGHDGFLPKPEGRYLRLCRTAGWLGTLFPVSNSSSGGFPGIWHLLGRRRAWKASLVLGGKEVAESARHCQAIHMAESNQKADLRRYLQDAREALLWKLDGLSEYDVRRPMVPTGTNLLGLIKHLASAELGWFGDTFGRPSADKLPWDESDPNSDMFAAPHESREFITGLYRRAWAHADATIDALSLDAIGHVPWWPSDRNEVTLHHILIRAIAETYQHAGHADIIRELIDGAAGRTAERSNLPSDDPAWWRTYRDRVERAAQAVRGDRAL